MSKYMSLRFYLISAPIIVIDVFHFSVDGCRVCALLFCYVYIYIYIFLILSLSAKNEEKLCENIAELQTDTILILEEKKCIFHKICLRFQVASVSMKFPQSSPIRINCQLCEKKMVNGLNAYMTYF